MGLALALLAVLLVPAGIVWIRIRRYRWARGGPSRRDDRFVWGAHAETFPVTLRPDGFELPAGLERRDQTAFLELAVAASTLGHLLDPAIDVAPVAEPGGAPATSAVAGHRQVFERGATGRRYLNLTPLFSGDGGAAPPRRIALRGHAIDWGREASLTVFERPPLPAGDILVLAPHPDDAEIAAFGLYATRPSAAWVVTMTTGERSSRDLSVGIPRRADLAGNDAGEDAGWAARLRLWDSLTIPQLGGVPAERCINLVYPDGRLRDLRAAGDAGAALACEATTPRSTLRAQNRDPDFRVAGPACTWQGLVGDLRRVLDKTRPAVVICPHPLLDAHPDHVHTTIALAEALGAGGPAPATVLLYAVFVRDAPLHPYGPADTIVSLPPVAADDPIADAPFSLSLVPDVRRLKYFAVEAAHDLRAYAGGGAPTARRFWAAARRDLAALVSGTGPDPASYLRRAPRPNELFYVVSPRTLGELVTRARATAS